MPTDEEKPIHSALIETTPEQRAERVKKFLSDGGVPPYYSGTPPLHYAIEINDIQLVRGLIEAGFDINSTTTSGTTPLHIAISLRKVAIILLLLNKGAQVCQESLFLAIAVGEKKIVLALLNKGVPTHHLKNADGLTASKFAHSRNDRPGGAYCATLVDKFPKAFKNKTLIAGSVFTFFKNQPDNKTGYPIPDEFNLLIQEYLGTEVLEEDIPEETVDSSSQNLAKDKCSIS